MTRILPSALVLLFAAAACGSGGKPAQEPENADESAADKKPADDSSEPSGTATIKDDTKKKASPCGGFDIPDLVAVLSQSECEVPDRKPDAKDVDVKDLLEIKVVPESPRVPSGASTMVTVTFHNKSKAELPLDFVVDPEPRFDFELYTPSGDRADKPAGDEPSLPESVANATPPEHHLARVTLAQQGTARLTLKWNAVKYKWASAEKAKGALPGHGYPREPGGPLKKGKYILRVITPLVGVFEGIDKDVSQPRVPIEVTKP